MLLIETGIAEWFSASSSEGKDLDFARKSLNYPMFSSMAPLGPPRVVGHILRYRIWNPRPRNTPE